MSRTFLVAAAMLIPLSACGDTDTEERASPPARQAEQGTSQPTPASAETSIAALAAPASKDAALKLMHDRHEWMEEIGDATKATGRTLKSGNPDLAVIRKSADTIASFAPKVPSWFPPGTGPDVGKTEALSAIWEKPQDFSAKARQFNAAAQAFQAAARSGDMAAIKDKFAALGKTCKACHDPYREEH